MTNFLAEPAAQCPQAGSPWAAAIFGMFAVAMLSVSIIFTLRGFRGDKS